MKKLLQHKTSFTERLKKRYSLRFHMSLILLTTVCSGFLATRLLLALHLDNVLLRYPLAVIFAYLVFFVSVKLWLKYVASAPTVQTVHDNSPDLLDVLPDLPLTGPGNGGVFRGGGGGFDGGGASGGFGDANAALADSSAGLIPDGVDSGGIGDALGETVGDAAASALGDEVGVAAVIVFAALAAIMAVVVGAGVYLVYEAPFILSEAAFEFVLAAGLMRGTRRIDSNDWVGSVFKTTAIPFGLTLALALLAGYLMHRWFPGVTRISGLFALL